MFSDTDPVFEFRGPWVVPVQTGASIVLLPLILVDFFGSPRDLMLDLVFLAILIGSICLHELGHARGALIQCVPVARITLYGGTLFELLLHVFPGADLAIRISAAVGQVIAVLWLPLRALLFMITGIALFVTPSIRMHWCAPRRHRA